MYRSGTVLCQFEECGHSCVIKGCGSSCAIVKSCYFVSKRNYCALVSALGCACACVTVMFELFFVGIGVFCCVSM